MKDTKTQIKFMSFCDYALMDQGQKLSILGIFDQINVQKFPGGIARAFFVAQVKTQPNIKTKFSLKGNFGEKTIFSLIEMDAAVGETGYHNIMLDFAGVAFPEPGTYKFILSQDGKEIGSLELKAIQMTYNASKN